MEPDPRYGPKLVREQAQAAWNAGLDSLTLGDHHATGPVSYVQNVPMLGHALADWGERPAGCLFLVPLWHPVLLAEQVGTLAAIASGPFIVQTGLGAGKAQFGAMGVQMDTRVNRLEEGVAVVRALLGGESVDSELFGIKGAQIAPLPPGPVEWWMGAAVPKAIDRAARLGDCWYGGPELTPESARQALEEYREACARHDRQPVRVPVRKDVFIADSNTEATKLGDHLMAAGYRGLERTAVAYGDPPAVAEQLAVFRELGFTDVIMRIMPAPAAATVEAVRLAGEVQKLMGS